MNLPPVIPRYIEASNAHDVEAILDCFADDAVVRDENATRHGKIDIGCWATETIQKIQIPLQTAERRWARRQNDFKHGSIRIISRQPDHARLPFHYCERQGRIANN